MIVLLIAGLVAAIYLVQQKTNIFPKAFVSEPVQRPVEPAVTKIELDVGTGTKGESEVVTKDVKPDETITYAPVGFSGDPEIIPGKKYYIRLYNGQYSEKQSFTTPSCMYTGR